MMKSKDSSSKKLIKCNYMSTTYILHAYYIYTVCMHVSTSYSICNNDEYLYAFLFASKHIVMDLYSD